MKSATFTQYFITGCGPLRSEETQSQFNAFCIHFSFLFLVKDKEEIGDSSKIENQEECRYFGEVRNSKENKHFTETVSFKEVDNVKTMSTQSSIQKFEVQAKRHEQAALDARHKAAKATEKKEKKLAKKEARDRKKRDEKLRKGHRDETDNDNEGQKLGATNVSFYPFYQQVMNRLSVEFIIRMKEEKDSSSSDKFMEKFIQHVGAVDTSVRDITVEEVVQTIKDKIVDTSQAQVIATQMKKMMMMLSLVQLM